MIYTSREVYEYISHKTNDPIVERKTCAVSGTQFPIYQTDLDFYKKISPTFAGERFEIPTPTLCPEERQRRRIAFRNERKLYKRKCDASGKDIISIYSPNKPYKVYDQKIRWSDAWDPMDYGRDIDFTRSFTEQFGELMREVPLMSLLNYNNEDSEYTAYTANSKSCYLCSTTAFSEKLMYTASGRYSNNSVDCLNITECNWCFNSINLSKCNNLINSRNCSDCNFSSYLMNCSGCEYCYGCSNLINKKFCYFNKQLSEDAYKKVIHQALYKYNDDILYLPNLDVLSSEGVYGDSLKWSHDSVFCYDSNKINKVKYANNSSEVDDSFDVTCFGFNCYNDYEVITAEQLRECKFCLGCVGGDLLFYSNFCFESSHLFGCIGLRNKSHCVFNKQYTKEEYEIIVGTIIRHMQTTREWGEFFHPSLSPFGYNETVAQEYYPLCRDGSIIRPITNNEQTNNNGRINDSPLQADYSQFGYHRSTYSSDPIIPSDIQTIDLRKPERSMESDKYQIINNQLNSDTRTELIKQIFICEISGRPFRLQKAELEFYRKLNIEIPRKHPDIRHEERMKLRPGRTLYLRDCDCCHKEMLSVYPSSPPNPLSFREGEEQGKIYCESCYQKELYA